MLENLISAPELGLLGPNLGHKFFGGDSALLDV